MGRLQRAVDRLMVGALCLLGLAAAAIGVAFAAVLLGAAWRIVSGVLCGMPA